jgi:hypothetical protein
MKIFVGGSLRNVPTYGEICQLFVQHLGQRIVERGHMLLGGTRGSLDMAVAEAADKWLASNDRDKRKQLILSYRLKNDQPAHRFGTIEVSQREDWDLAHEDLSPPEQIAEADVTVFIAGRHGTLIAANWARIAKKPILGVAQFGGAGMEIFGRECRQFEERYSDLVKAREFNILRQDTDDVNQLANEVVTLCEKIVTSNDVFTIMPFTAEFDDVFKSYFAVCAESGFSAQRTDQSESGERIIPRILAGIRRAAFVIADVTQLRANVFYEIGFAHGMGKPVIVSAKKGTVIPFDIADIPVLFYSGPEELKEILSRRVGAIAKDIRKNRDI